MSFLLVTHRFRPPKAILGQAAASKAFDPSASAGRLTPIRPCRIAKIPRRIAPRSVARDGGRGIEHVATDSWEASNGALRSCPPRFGRRVAGDYPNFSYRALASVGRNHRPLMALTSRIMWNKAGAIAKVVVEEHAHQVVEQVLAREVGDEPAGVPGQEAAEHVFARGDGLGRPELPHLVQVCLRRFQE